MTYTKEFIIRLKIKDDNKVVGHNNIQYVRTLISTLIDFIEISAKSFNFSSKYNINEIDLRNYLNESDDKIPPFLLCGLDHIETALNLRIEHKSIWRCKQQLYYLREDINKAVRILNKEEKREMKLIAIDELRKIS